jgi:hypothetical protein
LTTFELRLSTFIARLGNETETSALGKDFSLIVDIDMASKRRKKRKNNISGLVISFLAEGG